MVNDSTYRSQDLTGQWQLAKHDDEMLVQDFEGKLQPVFGICRQSYLREEYSWIIMTDEWDENNSDRLQKYKIGSYFYMK